MRCTTIAKKDRDKIGRPTAVESRTGAPALGSGGCSGTFAPGLSPAPMAAFPVPAHQTGRAVFPHPAFGRDHAFALGMGTVFRVRAMRPYSFCSLMSENCTNIPVCVLCFRPSHWRSRFPVWRLTAAVRWADVSEAEVVGPSAQGAVQAFHHLLHGLVAVPWRCHVADFAAYALDACLAGPGGRRKAPFPLGL